MLDLSTVKPIWARDHLAGEPAISTVREAVGVFKNISDMRSAITELDDRFPRHAISVLGSRAEVEAQFGQPAVAPERAMDDPNAPHAAPIRTEEKVIGNTVLIGSGSYLGAVAMAIAAGAMPIPAIITAVAIGAGTGAAIGGVLASLLQSHFTKDIEAQVEQGGLLLWVHTDDADQEHIACDIMTRHGAGHVGVHTITL